VGLGTKPVSKEKGQGFKQTGGTTAKPYLEQDNIPKTGAKTVLQTGVITSLETGANSSRTGPEIGSGTGLETGSRNRPEIGFRIGLETCFKTSFEPISPSTPARVKRVLGHYNAKRSYMCLKVTRYHGLRIDQSLTLM